MPKIKINFGLLKICLFSVFLFVFSCMSWENGWHQIEAPKKTGNVDELIARANEQITRANNKEKLMELIDAYEAVLEIDPANYEVLWSLGRYCNLMGYAYSSLGMHEKAMGSLLRYLELAPDEPNPHDSMGEIYQIAGHIDEAIHEYKEALRLKSDLHFPWEHMGSAFMDKGKFDDALRSYRRYVEAAPRTLLNHMATVTLEKLSGQKVNTRGR